MTAGPAPPFARAREAARERRFFLSLSLPALGVVGVAAVLPILWIVWQSFLNLGGDPTLANWTKILNSGLTWSALQTTFVLSGLTLVICVALGTPLALALASTTARRANLLLVFLLLPLWTSILVRTYGWLVLLRREGLVNGALQAIGLTSEPLPLVYNTTGVVIGMVHYMLPLYVLPVYAAMRDIDGNVVRAAASMGATLGQAIRTVILPLARGGILSGSVIVFVYTLGFFITPAVLGGGKVNPIAIRIERTIGGFQDWGGASVLGVLLLMVVALVGVTVLGLRRVAGVRHA